MTKRRSFLIAGASAGLGAGLGTAGVVLAGEARVTVATVATAATGARPTKGTASAERARIRRLELQTAAPLGKLETFYRDVLGFPVSRDGGVSLEIAAGATQIAFRPAPEGTDPFYHFAFNIPENKVLAARNWLAERAELMKTPAHMLDAAFPDDVRFFRNWNAHAVFFWDPAGNILECIGRHTLTNAAPGPFRAGDMHYVSEIGLVTEDVVDLGERVQRRFGLPQYRNASETFRALGDEQGLLLVFKRGSTAGASETRTQQWNVFPTDVSIHNHVEFRDPTLPYSILAGF